MQWTGDKHWKERQQLSNAIALHVRTLLKAESRRDKKLADETRRTIAGLKAKLEKLK